MAKSPAKQAYLYTGPVTPLDVPGHPSRMLYPGTSYRDLPADSPIVQNLIERGLLTVDEVSQPEAPTAITEGA